MKRSLVLLTFFIFLLTGCMYPSGELSKNQVPNEVQLQSVQLAVEQYQENNMGLVPIKTKPNDTPIFEKYVIDFSKLKAEGLISEIPGSAFENGGTYQYVLLTPEENPVVKVVDLGVAQQLREIEFAMRTYRNEHIYPPFGEKVAEGVYGLNYKELGLKTRPLIDSPYSENKLPVVMDAEGKLYVDYSADLYQLLKEMNFEYKKEQDIRYLLTDNSPFVPSYSLPYTVVNEEPVISIEAG